LTCAVSFYPPIFSEGKAKTHLSPPNQTPMPVDSPTQRNLFSLFGTRRCRQLNRHISSLERHDPSTRLTSTNVDKECLADSEFGDFGLLGVVRLDPEKPAEEEDCDVSDALPYLKDSDIPSALISV
jgi:hypothetical protein